MKNFSIFLLGFGISFFSCVYFKSKLPEKKVSEFIGNGSVTIDDVHSPVKTYRINDSLTTTEVKAVEVPDKKQVKQLRDSFMILASKYADLDRAYALLKEEGRFNAPQIMAHITDTSRSDQKTFNYRSKWLNVAGIIKHDTITFPADSISVQFKPAVIFGEKRKWFLGKVYPTAVLYDENPYVQYSKATFVSTKPVKLRHFGGFIGYGATYDLFNKKVSNGLTAGIGFIF